MIAQIKGSLVEVNSENAVVDVNGVGYEVFCSLNTLAEFQTQLMGGMGATAEAHRQVTVFTYTHVREDALQLFGFSTQQEKHLFITLLKVNGIGPKMAINILSGATADQIFNMIESEDVKALSKLPKVGKKTAEQMILTLKGKLVLNPSSPAKAGKEAKTILAGTHKEIASALVNLGFRPQDVDVVISQMPKEIDLQQGIRQGLSALTSV